MKPVYGSRARIGLVVPANNSVIEPELWSVLPAGCAVYATRLLAKGDLTPEAIRRFPLDSAAAVWLCPGGLWPDTPTIPRGAQIIHLVGIPEQYKGLAMFFESELRQFAGLPARNGNGNHPTDDRLIKGKPLPDTWTAMLHATQQQNGSSHNGNGSGPAVYHPKAQIVAT